MSPENNKNSSADSLKDFFWRNNVTILFILLSVGAFIASKKELTYLTAELFTRIGRNTFLVLSLIVPVVAGLGLNFGIVLGAIAAQIAIFLVVHWGFTGLNGILICVLISTPLAMLLGYMCGALFNKMKGTEMIGGLITGYFSDGIYQLLFLFILGGVIKINNPTLMISTGVGVKNTINLQGNLKYAVDNVPMISILDAFFMIVMVTTAIRIIFRLVKKTPIDWKKVLPLPIITLAAYLISFIPQVSKFLSTDRLLLLDAVNLAVFASFIYNIYKVIDLKLIKKSKKSPSKHIINMVIGLVIIGLTYIDSIYKALLVVKLPVLTYLLIGGLYVLTGWFIGTRLGQNMRTVGQDRAVATSAGINVDRTRIIAMIISTVLASYGQIISLQNIGTVSTYGAHTQVGQFAIAALLVGGASINRATPKNAVLGVILFHSLFILSPIAGKELLGNAQIGEYFRVFVAYGVIALALAMHAWNGKGTKQIK